MFAGVMNTGKTEGKRLPVTVLSGFLGSGKTTLLQNILRGKDHGLRCAVIVNDMAELNIDAEFVKRDEGGLIQREEKLVEMQNGCICCTLREDLLEEVTQLAKADKFDYLVIESTGISEPMQVAETFSFDVEDGKSLFDVSRLDTCVTVVDAANFYTNFHSVSPANAEDVEDERTVVDLMVEQLEFANVIILNKIELVTEEEKEKLVATIRKLNVKAEIIPTTFSRVDLGKVLNTKAFSMEEAASQPGWLQELRGEHKPETEEYGISSFVYRSRRPFNGLKLRRFLDSVFIVCDGITDKTQAAHRRHEEVVYNSTAVCDAAQRDELLSAMKSKYGNLLRSKGSFWVASRHHCWGHWSHAGVLLRVGSGGLWYAEVPREEWGETEEERALTEKLFEGEHGDRRTEIVMIGQGLNREAITKALDECLVEEGETFGPPTVEGPVKHWGITCDVTGEEHILGNRYHKKETDYDLCEAAFNKLSPEEQVGFEKIETSRNPAPDVGDMDTDGFEPWPSKEFLLFEPEEDDEEGHEGHDHGHEHGEHAGQGIDTVDVLETLEDFNKCTAENQLVLVDFTATWCPPCKQIAPVFASMAAEEDMKDITFVKVDVDANAAAAQAAGIDCMPTFQFFKGGKMVDDFKGASEEGLRKLIAKNR